MQAYRWAILLWLLPTLVLGQGSGNTLTFDGVSEAINLGNEVANGCRTVEIWFKLASPIGPALSGPVTLIARDFNNGDGASTNEFALCFYPAAWENGGRLAFFRRIGSELRVIFSDEDQWAAGHWIHVTAVIDPQSGMSLYINGVKQLSTDPSTQPIGDRTESATDNVGLGQWGNIPIRFFDGEMDEVRLWSTARSQEEIRGHMCAKLAGNEAGLRAYYSFDEEGGNGLADDTGRGYEGELLNMNAANRMYSGAPIGDVSTYVYPQGGWTGQTHELRSGPEDYLSVQNIQSVAEGIHIYRVNEFPNSFTDLAPNVQSHYYGVFLTDISGDFEVEYVSENDECICPAIFSRNDNSVLAWTELAQKTFTCSFSLANQSRVGASYRAEYIVADYGVSPPAVDLGPDTSVCQGENILLEASLVNVDATYAWQDGSTESTLTASQQGTYWVEVVEEGCRGTDTLVLDWIPAPTIEVRRDTFLCEGRTLEIDAGLNPFVESYMWQDGSVESVFTVSQQGEYWVATRNECGEDTAFFSIEVENCNCLVHAPNAFTPNGDEYNEGFRLFLDCRYQAYELMIFNQWGNLVFRSDNPEEEWDGLHKGKQAQEGVYVYVVRYVTPLNGMRHTSGSITLVR